MIERRTFAAVGAGLAFFGVAGGAFGAHFLDGRVSGELLDVFETAVEYQMYHAFGLLLVGGLSPQPHEALNQWAGKLFVVGTIVFSGSLYLLALTGARWLGAVTPIGGVCLLAGWGALCWSLISRPKMDARTGESASWTRGG